MALPEFDFTHATDLKHALSLLDKHGDEAKLAGGTTVFLTMARQGLILSPHVVGISRLKELKYIKKENGQLRIGALTTHRDIEKCDILQKGPMSILSQMEADVASVQIRNRGTVGGNLAYAEPTCDPPPVFLALDASVEICSAAGKRTVPIGSFYKGLYYPDLNANEIITEVSMPVLPDHYSGYYYKFTQRKGMDKPFVGVAAVVCVENNVFKDVRIAVGAVAEIPFRATQAEESLKGQKVSPEAIEQAGKLAAQGVECIPDLRCSEEYKLKVLPLIVKRAINKAIEAGKK